MLAIETRPPGGWQHTSVSDVEEPVAGPGDAIVEMRAVGLNPADGHLIEGRYPGGPQPPFIGGRDGAGVVVAMDADGRWPVGSEVVVLQSSLTDLSRGTFCRRQAIGAENLAAKPADWNFAEAAGPLVYQTAWQALVDLGGLDADKTVVVTGASGGVGLACVQLARGLGATVVALSRSAAKRERLLACGADFAFDPQMAELKRTIFDAIGRKGVDLVVDNVGGPSLTQAVHLLGTHGRVSVVGVLGGIEGAVPIPSLMFKQASIHGVLVTGYSPAEARAAWQQIVLVLERTGQRPVVAAELPLAEFAEAFAALKHSPFGKIVLKTAE